MEKTGDIADLVGLACVLAARNGANGNTPARICADMKNRTGTAEQACCAERAAHVA